MLIPIPSRNWKKSAIPFNITDLIYELGRRSTITATEPDGHQEYAIVDHRALTILSSGLRKVMKTYY